MKNVSVIVCCVSLWSSGAVAQSPPHLERALNAELRLLGIRRCYNDRMITNDMVSMRLSLTNVGADPLALVPDYMPIARSRVWEAGEGWQPQTKVWDLSGHEVNPARPENLAVLWPEEVVARDIVLNLVTLRPGAERRPSLLQRIPHVLALNVTVRLAAYEGDEQPVSSARPFQFETSLVRVDLSAPMAIEFCR